MHTIAAAGAVIHKGLCKVCRCHGNFGSHVHV